MVTWLNSLLELLVMVILYAFEGSDDRGKNLKEFEQKKRGKSLSFGPDSPTHSV